MPQVFKWFLSVSHNDKIFWIAFRAIKVFPLAPLVSAHLYLCYGIVYLYAIMRVGELLASPMVCIIPSHHKPLRNF